MARIQLSDHHAHIDAERFPNGQAFVSFVVEGRTIAAIKLEAGEADALSRALARGGAPATFDDDQAAEVFSVLAERLRRGHPTRHTLKTHPEPFAAIREGLKTHEVRREADRTFAVGDVLELMEWDPVARTLTGERLLRTVTYLTRGPDFGVPPGLVVLSIR